MKLKTHLRETGETQPAFAARVGTTQSAISRYCSGERIPRREMILKIDAATNGAVPPESWFLPDDGAEFGAPASVNDVNRRKVNAQ